MRLSVLSRRRVRDRCVEEVVWNDRGSMLGTGGRLYLDGDLGESGCNFGVHTTTGWYYPCHTNWRFFNLLESGEEVACHELGIMVTKMGLVSEDVLLCDEEGRKMGRRWSRSRRCHPCNGNRRHILLRIDRSALLHLRVPIFLLRKNLRCRGIFASPPLRTVSLSCR